MDNNKKQVFINISAMSIVKIILVLIMFYVFFLIKEILALLFVALVLASAIDPWVDFLQDKKIPRGISVITIYFMAFCVVLGSIALVIPPIIEQVDELSHNLPALINQGETTLELFRSRLDSIVASYDSFRESMVKYGFYSETSSQPSFVPSNLLGAAGGVFSTLKGFVASVFSFFIVLVLTFYMVVEEKAIKKVVCAVAPPKYQMYIMGLVNRMQQKIGLWLRGQLILSFIIFSLTFVGLSILGVEYALVLALIAGLTEFVPYLGPTLAAIPAIFLAFTQAPVLAIFVAVLYYIIQLTENNIIVPKLMQKVVGLNPIVSIAVLLIGFELGGIAGAILSIPVATAVSVFIHDLFENKVKPREEN